MTTLNVNTIEPAGNTLTIGASGDTVVLADDVKSNTYKDAGGNTLFVSNGSGTLSSVNSGFGDALKLLSTSTFTNQATVSFTSGIDSTYKEYIFKFVNCNPATDNINFTFQGSIDDGSNYNVTMQSSFFWGYHQESGANSGLEYHASSDQANGTAFQKLTHETGSDADQSCVGKFHLFNPSSTTYVKHFLAKIHNASADNKSYDHYTAGYFNTTTAINAIQFKMSSGNFDGTIKMYGVA